MAPSLLDQTIDHSTFTPAGNSMAKKTPRKKAAARKEPSSSKITIEFDLDKASVWQAKYGKGYPVTHVDLELPVDLTVAIRAMKASFDKACVRRENGRVIQTQHDCIRWILEQIYAQLPEISKDEHSPPTGGLAPAEPEVEAGLDPDSLLD